MTHRRARQQDSAHRSPALNPEPAKGDPSDAGDPTRSDKARCRNAVSRSSFRMQHGRTKAAVTSDRTLATCLIVLVAVTVVAFVQMDYGTVNMIEAVGESLRNFAVMAFEPNLGNHFDWPTLLEGLLITLSIATLTTLGGAVIALVLGLIAASNLTNRAVSNAIKIVMSVIRAVPTIIWVLIFTVAIGLGAEAAVVGMMFHSVAYLTKAYSESFEEVDQGALEALRATGATKLQIVSHAVFPEKINEMLSWTFIRFEINFTSAVVVAAIAGSGGIGYQLYMAANFYFNMHEIGCITYLCLIVSVILEIVATKLRKRFIVHR